MKYMIFLVALLMIATQTMGKKKSKEQLQIDTLTAQNKALTAQLDSVNGQLTIYTGMYGVIQEKVFKYKFDPAKTSVLIDSLRAGKDSASVLSSVNTKSADSLKMLIVQNKELVTQIDSIKLAWDKEKNLVPAEEMAYAKAIGGLKQLKELLDQKIITDPEFATLKKKYIQVLQDSNP